MELGRYHGDVAAEQARNRSGEYREAQDAQTTEPMRRPAGPVPAGPVTRYVGSQIDEVSELEQMFATSVTPIRTNPVILPCDLSSIGEFAFCDGEWHHRRRWSDVYQAFHQVATGRCPVYAAENEIRAKYATSKS